MKLFALLLFSLEFLAPAILVDIASSESHQDSVQLIDGSRHQNILFSIFTEEITENEEGREGQRDILLFADFGFDSTFFQLVGPEPIVCKHSSLISEQFDTQPALFKLNCTFLI